MAEPSLASLCFDQTIDRKPRGTITLNQLHQWFLHSKTEEEREICFKAVVFDRLCINNFKEVVHLFMDPNRNEIFANNPKILQSLKGKIVLDGENEDFCAEFFRIFLLLLARLQGDLLIVFVNVKSYENLDQMGYCEVIARKRDCGEKNFLITYNCGNDVQIRLGEHQPFSYTYLGREEYHAIHIIKKITCVEETKLVIEMINEDQMLSNILPQCKLYMPTFLPTLDRYKLEDIGPDGLFAKDCECDAALLAYDNFITVEMRATNWSNCDDCKVMIDTSSQSGA